MKNSILEMEKLLFPCLLCVHRADSRAIILTLERQAESANAQNVGENGSIMISNRGMMLYIAPWNSGVHICTQEGYHWDAFFDITDRDP